MRKITVIGDSHVSLYSNVESRNRGTWSDLNLNVFDCKWLGPFTFWRLCRDQRSFIDLDNPITYNPGVMVTTKCDTKDVMIVLGEIDVRCHILKFGYNKFEETVDNMIKFIKEFVVGYDNRFKFHFQSIMPPIYKVNFGNKLPLFPFVGSDYERRDVTNYFNKKLRKLGEEINVGYFDIFDIYSDKNNMMILEKSDKIVHAMKTPELEKYIKEYFKL